MSHDDPYYHSHDLARFPDIGKNRPALAQQVLGSDGRAHAPGAPAPALPRVPDSGESRPELAQKFFDWYGAVFAEGALSAREKSLIALAVAHAVQCPYCIEAYSKDALEKGSDL